MTIIRISNLDSEKIGPNLWRLNRPLLFGLPHGVITVPKNFITDGASRPQSMASICNRMSGHEAEAAVLHDYLYSKDSNLGFSRKQADVIFRDAMLDGGVKPWKAKLIYLGVRAGGKASFKKLHSIDKVK